MVDSRRDRVTVDLRGAGRHVHARAAAEGLTLAAYARRALLAGLDVPSEVPDTSYGTPRGRTVKVTVRLSPDHAFLLARRSRRADMSQGNYLAGLLDGVPLGGLSPGRQDALNSLSRSCDLLATISTDLNEFMRLIHRANAAQLDPYRLRIRSLDADVRAHLAAASAVLAQVGPSKVVLTATGAAARR